MNRRSEPRPVGDRARWLADLARSIVEAQRVAWELGVAGQQSAEALELYRGLQAAADEVARLQGGWRAERNEIGPDRTFLRQAPGTKGGFDRFGTP